jgi:uncharacterized protein YecE (DUF72 family)
VAKVKLPDPGSLLIGPSGWSHSRWQGLFYPNSHPHKNHPLRYLSRFFNSVEITSSLYAPLKPELSQVWAHVVSGRPDFQFSARAWRKLLESPRIDPADVAAFRAGLKPLEEAGRLGAVLLEFPANFRFAADTRQRLIELRRALRHLPLVVEFRHASWMSEEALGVLVDYHIGFANLDQYEHSRAMPPTAFLTSPVGYVRLRGRNAPGPKQEPYFYCPQELDAWAHRIRKVNRFAKRTFVTFANDTGAASLVNTFQMAHLLGRASTSAPKSLIQRFPRELAALRPDTPLQTTLFSAQAA